VGGVGLCGTGEGRTSPGGGEACSDVRILGFG